MMQLKLISNMQAKVRAMLLQFYYNKLVDIYLIKFIKY